MREIFRENFRLIAVCSTVVACAAFLSGAFTRDAGGLLGPRSAWAEAGATGGTAGGAANHIIAVPVRISDSRDALFLVDTQNQNILIYAYDRFGQRRVELLGARTFEWDRLVKKFNTGTPTPEEIRDRVLIERASAFPDTKPDDKEGKEDKKTEDKKPATPAPLFP